MKTAHKLLLKSRTLYSVIFTIIAVTLSSCGISDDYKVKSLSNQYQTNLDSIFTISGENKTQLIKAISECNDENLEGLIFLLKNMPERDLRTLSSDFLLDNINLAYGAVAEVKWGSSIPKDIFLNYVLPYAILHERRDEWREDFYNQFLRVVINNKSTSEATLKLNKYIWNILDVHYSTDRPKADQSPYESIEAGQASCTGLSIILIDVCRAVGIPARFVGVPLWKDQSGNHSWVEIWDNGWHFIGAEEESPLNETWFGERAKTADDSDWKYSIYASSFKKTNVIFPPLFDSTATYVYADIITDRYSEEISDNGLISLAVRLFDEAGRKRVNGKIEIKKNGEIVECGETKNEKYDYNDFLILNLKPDSDYEVIAFYQNKSKSDTVNVTGEKYQFLNIYMND